jgi:uncharacterized membrane protein
VSSPPTSVHAVYNALYTFGFSFFILISMWLRYTRIMSVFPLENRRAVNLNVLLLFSVSIEPFLFNIIRNTPSGVVDVAAYTNTTSMLYALDLGAMFGIIGGFTLVLADEDRKLIPKALIRQYRIEGATWGASGLIFVVSAAPAFFVVTPWSSVQLRYYMWLIPLAIVWVTARIQRRAEDRISDADDV